VHYFETDILVSLQIPHKDLVVNVPTERRLNSSEPKQTERLPDYFDQIIAQIERYQPYRKQLFIAYYASLDYAAHIYGPDSDQAHKEMLKADVIVSDLQV
jgi:predicted AlkP superfamily pyrophosphatase or phosphodiesterase